MTKTTRRDPFAKLRENADSPLEVIPRAQDSEDERKKAERKAKRAAYDKAHPITSFYVPYHLQEKAREIQAAVTGLSSVYMSTAASISAALVRYAIKKVQDGSLVLDGRPAFGRRKLTVTWEEVDVSGDTWPPPQAIPSPPPKTQDNKPDPMYMGWRWPLELKPQISAIAGDALPVGEVVVRLLEYALERYQKGACLLKVEAVSVQQEVKAVAEKTWAR